MSKGLLIVAVLLGTAIAIDEHYNFGLYTDRAISMLRHIRHSFG